MSPVTEPTHLEVIWWMVQSFFFLVELGLSCFLLGVIIERLWQRRR